MNRHYLSLIALALLGPFAACDSERSDRSEPRDAPASVSAVEPAAVRTLAEVALPPPPNESMALVGADEVRPDQPAAKSLSGWTDETSEEYPPIVCDYTSMVAAWSCTGPYCNNVRMRCEPTGTIGQQTVWLPYVSEEGTNYRYCPINHWMVGVDCRGGYCDDLSIQCKYFPGLTPQSCIWTGWISEEGGGVLEFSAGYYARGLQCGGSSCDNKRFYVCRK